MNPKHRLNSLVCVAILTLPLLFAPLSLAFPGPVPTAHTVLSSPSVDASEVVSAPTTNGSAVAAWVETNSSTFWRVRAATYSPLSGWSVPTWIQNETGITSEIQIAADASGTATLLWRAWGNPIRLWYSQAPLGGSWSTPSNFRNVSSPLYIQGAPHLGVSPGGRAVFSWMEQGGSAIPGVWAAVVETGGALSGPVPVSNAAQGVIVSSLAVNSTGFGFAVWCDWNGSGTNLGYAKFSPGTGWGAFAIAVVGASNACGSMAAAADGQGAVTVLWGRNFGATSDVGMVRFTAAGGWGAPTQAAATVNFPNQLWISPAADGGLIAAWNLAVPSGPMGTIYYSTFAAGFTPSGGWGPAVRLVNNSTNGVAFRAGVAALPGGAGFVASSYLDGPSAGIQVRQHFGVTGCGSWSDAAFAAGTSPYQRSVSLAVDPSGAGVALFSALNGSNYELRAAPIQAAEPPSPVILSPLDGAIIESSLVTLVGSTAGNSTVESGSYNATADANGNFSFTVPLLVGANTLTVKSHLAGAWSPCITESTVRVTYLDPVPGLKAALEGAVANVTALTAALAAADARIADLEAQALVSQADLDAARANLTAAQVMIHQTQTELDRVKVQFPWLQDNLTATQTALDASRADLAAAQARIDLLNATITVQNATVSAQDDILRALQKEVDILQANLLNANNATAAAQVSADGARSTGGLATVFGLIGMLFGAAGLGVALTVRRRARTGREPPDDHAPDAKTGKARDEEK